jgi:hypothetical protein
VNSTATKVVQGAPPAPGKETTKRIDALDFVKGALVVFMVIYHSLNRSIYHPLAFRYLAFLPPSFILIVGFILTSVYSQRYDLRAWHVHQRLLIRGLKLVLIFTLLNMLVYAFVLGNPKDPLVGLEGFLERWNEIYVHSTTRVASFSVLLSISYFLLAAPFLLRFQVWKKWFIPLAAFISVSSCVVMEYNGELNGNVGMASAGSIGLALGLLPISRINQFAKQWYLTVPAYLIYRGLSYMSGETYAVQMLGACVTLFLLYGIALQLADGSQFYRFCVFLGNYSLLAYIMQILLLQVLIRVIGHPARTIGALLAVVFSTLGATYLVTLCTDQLRMKLKPANSMYKAVFT